VTVACVLALVTFVAAVDRHRALDDVQGQEAEDRGEHGQGNAEQLAGLLGERLGYQVEADDTEHEPCGEPKDECCWSWNRKAAKPPARVVRNDPNATSTGIIVASSPSLS
jgi:hypothetical protein